MTADYLLDSSAVIALANRAHEHNERTSRWVAGQRRLALCPITEGSLVRYMLRLGDHPSTSTRLLQGYYTSPLFEFWPDDLSYSDVDVSNLRGHRQVTDAYLVALAASRGARLATLDAGLAAMHPSGAFLIPS